ncbi:MAG: zinc-dependent alcohol dehydrogenase [Christensenellaceae bacterium]
MDKMKAVVLHGPGEYGVELVDIPKPGMGEVLCRIRANAICGSDPNLFAGRSRNVGWPPAYPFIPGHEWAGEVVALGEGASGVFKVGDRVAGEAHCGCGICGNCKKGLYTLCENYGKPETGHRHYGFLNQGAYAEYGAFKERTLTHIPDGVSFDEATICDSGGAALNGMRLAGTTNNGYTAVYGPGPIGNICMQIAKAKGAKTIMIGRRERLDEAGTCGADHCVNYEQEDPIEAVMRITGGKGAHEVIECAGTDRALYQSVLCARKAGKVAIVAMHNTGDIEIPVRNLVMNQIGLLGSRANPDCSEEVLGMVAEGTLDAKKLITHTFPIEEIKEAIVVFEGRLEGAMKVVIHP